MKRAFVGIAGLLYALAASAVEPVPDKTVVLTFDDAVKSHRTFVGPLLKEYGFGATFFVTALWMSDTANFMSWQDIAELHAMGFEIGNHSWSHSNFGNPKYAARLEGQLFLVEQELEKVGVPKPTSFAWCGNTFSPEGAAVLRAKGYTIARRGMQPEIPYGQIKPGPMYDPSMHDPLLIPSAGDAYPTWTLEDFRRVVDRAKDGKIAVVQFHGVPDIAHPWVHTPPERFREYMDYLKSNGFHVVAMRDLARFMDPAHAPSDAMAMVNYTPRPLELPEEVAKTRADPKFWLWNTLEAHRYSMEEAAEVFGLPVKTLEARLQSYRSEAERSPVLVGDSVTVLPYPGGRHPRIGFLDGAVQPKRGTKASVFAPWGDASYAVIDLPEAIFSESGLMFLAHTHVVSLWDQQHTYIENVDWQRKPDGALQHDWKLPNGVRFGATVTPAASGADLELWLENGTDQPLTKLRTQVCVMLKGMSGFTAPTNDNKRFETTVAAAQGDTASRWVLVTFERCGRTWGNAKCPCIHADPVLPDAAPGERVRVRGKLWFYEGNAIEAELQRHAGITP